MQKINWFFLKKFREIDPIKKVAPLLVLSPNHGSISYMWEKRSDNGNWCILHLTPAFMSKVVAYINVH